MIDFKPITPEDKKRLTARIYPGERRDSNLSIVNLCSWQFLTCSSYAIVDSVLIIRFCFSENKTVYTIPEEKSAVEGVIRQLAKMAKKENVPLYLYGVIPEMKPSLEFYFPDVFEYRDNWDHFDYLYLRQDLAELKGQNYQPKRNHVNRFRKKYDYHFKPLTEEMIPDCFTLFETWCEERKCEEDESLTNERKALTYGLNHFHELGIVGAGLWIEGRMIAFTYGAQINHDTFCIHAEKALGDYSGAYNTINQEFAAYLPEKIVYINREEDLGISGLRKAKLSYHPAQLLEKGLAVCAEGLWNKLL